MPDFNGNEIKGTAGPNNKLNIKNANFGFLNEVITKLETKNLSLISQVNIWTLLEKLLLFSEI